MRDMTELETSDFGLSRFLNILFVTLMSLARLPPRLANITVSPPVTAFLPFSVSLSPCPQPQIRPFPPPPPSFSASSSSSPLSPVSHDPGLRLSVVLASRPLH